MNLFRKRLVLAASLALALLSLHGCDSKKTSSEPAQQSATSDPPAPSTKPEAREEQPAQPDENGRIEIEVRAAGYVPASVAATPGQPLTLVFTRTADVKCGEELVFPEHDIRKELPLNEPVEVQITPTAGERITFTCGMDMYRGAIVAHEG